MTTPSPAGATSEATFTEVVGALLASLTPGEHLTMDLKAEDGQFVRVNHAKVRQSGHVRVGDLTVQLILEAADGSLRESSVTVSVTGEVAHDLAAAQDALARLRAETPAMPPSPWTRVPERGASTHTVTRGALLDDGAAPAALLTPAAGLDLAGILASGTVMRGSATSAGRHHWFEADTFSFDYSVYSPSGAACKATCAGTRWDQDAWVAHVGKARALVELLGQAPRVIPPGEYRAFLGPAAMAEIVQMLSWGCIGEGAVRQGDSPLRRVTAGTHSFSPLFSLREDFTAGDVPRFDAEGEVSPELVKLVERGALVSTLISARTAREHGLVSNGADTAEALRSASILPGRIDEADIYAAIGTGLYIPNLWYLNWSDQPGGRITGMTRYACLWIEDGRPVGPVQHVRFDDNLFRILGSSLEGLTRQVHVVPETGSYEFRSLGMLRTPGLLLSQFSITL